MRVNKVFGTQAGVKNCCLMWLVGVAKDLHIAHDIQHILYVVLLYSDIIIPLSLNNKFLKYEHTLLRVSLVVVQ